MSTVAMRTSTATHRRDQILEEAARLFGRRGYHATSMRDIGEAAGILAGSLYAHISSKEDLLYEIVLRAAERFIDEVTSIAAEDAPAEERLRRAMRAHVAVVASNVDAAWAFHHEWKALSGERLQEIRRLRRRYERLWDGIVRELPDPVAERLRIGQGLAVGLQRGAGLLRGRAEGTPVGFHVGKSSG
jgi:TetR/AcrR family transcriptional regulator, cholesterol catabolism regulator